MPQPITNEPAPTTGKRRSRRFPLISPVEATWQDADGKIFRESGRATDVSAQGALLEMKSYPASGSRIELKSLLSNESSQARVVGFRRSGEGRLLGIGIELLIPSETFWGMNFRLKKACADLVNLEYDMRSGSVDSQILREFRDAVDNVRKTAWTVQEWQERQSRQQNPDTVLPLLTAERIRRATQLCDAISADSAARRVAPETVGIDDFFHAVGRVHQTLLTLLRDRKA